VINRREHLKLAVQCFEVLCRLLQIIKLVRDSVEALLGLVEEGSVGVELRVDVIQLIANLADHAATERGDRDQHRCEPQAEDA